MALGIGAYYFSSLISVATPILLVGVVVVVLGLFTNKTETPKNKVFDKKNSEENALRFNTKLTTGQRVNNNRYESVNLTIKPRH